MSASFEINSASGSYPVTIRPGALDAIIARGGDIVVLCDEYFTDHLKAAGVRTINLPALESTKSLDQMSALITALRESGVSRSTTVVAAGGGIVQDVACFIASVYMRGVKWDYVPTTLLAMVDSCIGGKSSINVGANKNIVGTIHPPRAIEIDPALCATLAPDQMVAGLVEAAKICFARSNETFGAYMALSPTIHSGPDDLTQLIGLSLAAKKWFVEVDEFDANERLLLNYGHTFGHAIESASKFRISHGVAVGLGIIAAGTMGRRLGRSYAAGSLPVAMEGHIDDLLRQVPDLRDAVAEMKPDDLITAFHADKKHTLDRFAVVVALEGGGVERIMIPRDTDAETNLRAAFNDMTERYAA
ncbi:3-dehydroquinate synthase family protein [uncultured Brevundimonas sp.]|uniref:3-dehydroquinate synthase n=1 Tax=uncultured Brevundimonas sp. TaxID=213418 RepID=UPI0030EC618A|tara:strand:+ start:8174 stop:9253 length:1080 start_codon:yes stop_codon:yes gene_type:complete